MGKRVNHAMVLQYAGETPEDYFSLRSTVATWVAAQAPLPPTPKGKEVYRFKVGQVVTATGAGQYKEGVRVKIVAREKVNGFCRYFDGAVWHHDTDLKE